MGMLAKIKKWYNGSEVKTLTPVISASAVKTDLAKLQTKEPENIEQLNDCMSKDPQFVLGTQIITALCLDADVTFECESKDPRHQLIVKDLERLWNETKSDTMESFGYGRVAFWKRWDTYNQTTKLQLVKCLDPLPFSQTELKLTQEGDFDGVILKVDEDNPKHIYPQNAWWLAIDATPKEPHGRSQYLGAPLETWKERQKYAKRIDVYDDKQAGGAYFLKAPQEIQGPITGKGDRGEIDENGNLIDGVADATRAAAALKTGGILGVASGNHADGSPLYEFTAIGTTGDSSHIQSRKSNLDDDALKSLGIPPKALDNSTGVGTYGATDSYRQTLASRCEQFLQQIVTSFKKYVVDKVLEHNFPEGSRPVVNLKIEPIYNPEMSSLLTLIQAIATSSSVPPMILSGVIDIQSLLKRAKIESVTDVQAAMDHLTKLAREQAASMLQVPTVPGSPAAEPVPGGEVAATALNGAQIASLLEIVTQAAAKQLPLAAVTPIIKAAFPTLDDGTISNIVRPLVSFTPPASAVQASLRLGYTPPKVTNQRALEDIASAQAKDIVQSLSDSLKGDGKIPTEDDARRHL